MRVYTITKEWEGSRLDRFIRAIFPGTPFGVIQILLRKGRIFLNSKKTDGSVRLKAGDVVAIEIEEIEEEHAPKRKRRSGRGHDAGAETRTKAPVRAPKRFNLDPKAVAPSLFGIGRDIRIVYEDESLLVIDKPAGLVVQPGNRKERGSLLDLLEEYRLRAPEPGRTGEHPPTTHPDDGNDVGPPFRYTPVHRLDRETSGVLLIAKTRKTARALSYFIARRMVFKEYVAMVEGVPETKTGEIAVRLATVKGTKSHAVPDPKGKEARTTYTVVKELPENRSLIKVSIDTGRTHQIRAHLASIGHPIVGDREYGAAGIAPKGRLFLHAWKIQLRHPDTGKVLVATVLPPEEFGLDGE
jgi:23S rRNA pseudouridine1911/1915/1917 synthase